MLKLNRFQIIYPSIRNEHNIGLLNKCIDLNVNKITAAILKFRLNCKWLSAKCM